MDLAFTHEAACLCILCRYLLARTVLLEFKVRALIQVVESVAAIRGVCRYNKGRAGIGTEGAAVVRLTSLTLA